MLGMMNCPSDSVEFYCEQPADSKIARDLPEEAAMFKKDGKQKSSITYTPGMSRLHIGMGARPMDVEHGIVHC
jgi:hypothetical protein